MAVQNIHCICRFEAEPIQSVLQEVKNVSSDQLTYPYNWNFLLCIDPTSGPQYIQFNNGVTWRGVEVMTRSKPIEWNVFIRDLRDNMTYGTINSLSSRHVQITLRSYKAIEIKFTNTQQSFKSSFHLNSALISIERYLDTISHVPPLRNTD